jgi:Na+/H+ antiporter NhaD/arsenite permease-like protein
MDACAASSGCTRRPTSYRESVPPHELQRVLTLAIFLAAYVGLGLGRLPGLRVDRTGVAIIGAAAMVVSGLLPWEDAVRSVDAHTLVLLFGMMIVTAYLRLSGFFRLVMTWALRRARTPLALLGAAMASTLAGNLTILGSVANLIVVEAARAARVEIGFVEYCKVGVPVTLVTLFLGWLLLAWY